jgi:UDP-2,4-diacetamido-2,4,6-trideoxy-beta-L-altropyranose hydrolase
MNLTIRADADAERGTGHLMRCLALTQACLSKGGAVTFVTACEAPALLDRISSL